jgi:hypothetical protein
MTSYNVLRPPQLLYVGAYLQHYSNDREAWAELADMYLEVRDNICQTL